MKLKFKDQHIEVYAADKANSKTLNMSQSTDSLDTNIFVDSFYNIVNMFSRAGVKTQDVGEAIVHRRVSRNLNEMGQEESSREVSFYDPFERSELFSLDDLQKLYGINPSNVRKIGKMKRKLFLNGCSWECRPLLWMHLLGVQIDEDLRAKFSQLKTTVANLDPTKDLAHSRELQASFWVIDLDSVRTDRKVEFFESDVRSQQLGLLLKMFCYSHPDPAYCQGNSRLIVQVFKVPEDS